MPENIIVIVTQKFDMHTDDMVRKLYEWGHEPIRLNTDDVPLKTALNFCIRGVSEQGLIRILTNGKTINCSDIRSIWWRRPSLYGLPPELSAQERRFAQEEITQVLRGLLPSNCYWMNYPESIRQASWKIGQLKRAIQHGFDVPRTLITSDPAEVRAFYEECNHRMVFKVLTDPYLAADDDDGSLTTSTDPRVTMTTLVSESELDQLESVRIAPCLFQEYIPKRLELRVTVIGDEIFAAEIDSQSSDQAAVDFRAGILDIPYRMTTLPPMIAEACMAFVRSYHLNFSAMDLILTPDGKYVFLENNPSGQFMWIEKLVPELQMTEALASCLVRGKG